MLGERLASASKTTEKANTTGCQWLVKCFLLETKMQLTVPTEIICIWRTF